MSNQTPMFPPPRGNRGPYLASLGAALAVSLFTLLSTARAETPVTPAEAPSPPTPTAPVEAQAPTGQAALGANWGIKVEGLRLSAAGYMLDLRYRVFDHEKAKRFFNHETAPYLLDPATGAILFIPSNAKLGKMRQVPVEGRNERVYFVLFANPGRYIKPGTRLSLVSGDDKLEGLVVEGGGTETKAGGTEGK